VTDADVPSVSSPSPGRPGLAGWPVNLLVAGRKAVVVGGGRIAARKIEGLLELEAAVTVVAPDIGSQVAEMADTNRVELIRRGFEASDLDDAWLVVTATDDPLVNATVFAEAETRRMFCNSADDPENCSFTLMSVVRQADLVVALGTGGRSPALATWLKQHVQQEMGPEYALLLDLLSETRETMRAGGRSSEDADWQLAFESGIVELVRDGRLDEARELLSSCL
jgi:siroheme synthase-like protein